MCPSLTLICFDVRIISWQKMVTTMMMKRKTHKLEVVIYKSLVAKNFFLGTFNSGLTATFFGVIQLFVFNIL